MRELLVDPHALAPTTSNVDCMLRAGGSTASVGEVAVAVRSFSGVVEVVRVVKRKGMEEVHLLYDDKDEVQEKEEKKGKSVWDTISRYIHVDIIMMCML